MNSNFNEPLLTASPDYAKIEWAIKELREDRDDVKDHLFKFRRSSGKSTSIRRRSKSMFFKNGCANGINVSSSSRSTFRIWLPPQSRTSLSFPMYSPSAVNTSQPLN